MSGYAYIENDEVAEIHFYIPECWKNVSNFNSLDEEGLLFYNWYPIIDYMDYDSSLYDLVDSKIIFEDNIAKRVPVLMEKPLSQ